MMPPQSSRSVHAPSDRKPLESQRLRALHRRRLLDAPREPAFDRLARVAASIFDVPYVSIGLVDHDRVYFAAERGIGLDEIRLEPGLCDTIVKSKQPLYLRDARLDPISANNSLVTGPLGLRFYAGIPLMSADGYCLGSMCIFDRKPRDLNLSERRMLFDLAESAVDLIERRLAERELRETMETLESQVEERTADLGRTVNRLEREIAGRREAERLRNESSAQLGAIFSAYPDMFCVMGKEGTILSASGGARASQFGLPETFLGEKMQDLFPREIGERLSRAAEEVQRTQALVTIEYSLATPMGHISYESRMLPLDGERIIAIIRDVTAVRSAEASARRSERLSSLGTLAAGMAHQINNPIGAILTASQFALLEHSNTGEPEIWRSALEHNIEQSRRCGQIVKSILQFSSEQATDRWEEDIISVIRRACNSIQTYARSYRAAIRFDFNTTSIPVYMSPIEIEQVFINILRNAVESRDHGVQIEIAVTTLETCVEIEIRDDGSGMDEAVRRRIFDPFYTERLHKGGTGLGMSVAHGFVTEHGGSITVTSQLQKGSNVCVRLPLSNEMTKEMSKESSNEL